MATKRNYGKSVETLVTLDRKAGEKVFSVELMDNGGYKIAELFNTKGEYDATANHVKEGYGYGRGDVFNLSHAEAIALAKAIAKTKEQSAELAEKVHKASEVTTTTGFTTEQVNEMIAKAVADALAASTAAKPASKPSKPPVKPTPAVEESDDILECFTSSKLKNVGRSKR